MTIKRGRVYIDLKQYEKALADYNKAIEIYSNLAIAYYGRGFCYQALSKTEKAKVDFAMATKLGYKG